MPAHARAEHALDRLLVVRVAGERAGDPRRVERERDAGDRHALGEPPLDLDREPPALRRARLEQRQRARGAQRLAAARGEQRGRAAVQHGLGGGDGDDEIGLDERRVDAQRHVAGLAELDEVVGLGVVHDHAALEATAELGRDEQADLARRRAPQQAAGDEDRHLCDAEAVELVDDRGDRHRAAGRAAPPGSAATAARSRPSLCRRVVTSSLERLARRAGTRAPRAPPRRRPRAARAAGGGRRTTSSVARLRDDDARVRRAAGSASRRRVAVRRGRRDAERDEDAAGHVAADAARRSACGARGRRARRRAARSDVGERARSREDEPEHRDLRRRPSRGRGSTNCGRNARKNSAVFGLSTLTTTPWRVEPAQRRRRRRLELGSSSSRARIRRTPTAIRYAAPTSLTTVNAVADDAISAESPTVAAATCTRPPLATPSAETRPARRPLSTLCVTM